MRNIVALIVLTIAWFTSAELTSAQNEPSHFKVGFIIPLTGTAADYGVAIKNCVELAKQDRPEFFNNIDFVYEDAAYEPRLAVGAFNRLVDVDRINLAVTWGVSFCKALAPIAETRKVPLVGLCIDPVAGAGKHFVLRFMNVTDEYMEVMTRYLQEHNFKKLGLLVAEHPYQEEMLEALKRTLKPGQTVTLLDRVPTSDADMRTRIAKLAKSDYDAIGVFLYMGQIAVFYRQAAELGFQKPTFGTNIFESLSEVRAARGAMEGALFTSMLLKEDFSRRYKSLFGNESQLAFGAPAYELAMTIGDLFNSGVKGLFSGEAIIQALANIHQREGVAAGPFTYVNDPKVGQYFRFPIVVKRVSGDGYKDLK